MWGSLKYKRYWQTLSAKNQIVNYILVFTGPLVCVASTQLCHLNMKLMSMAGVGEENRYLFLGLVFGGLRIKLTKDNYLEKRQFIPLSRWELTENVVQRSSKNLGLLNISAREGSWDFKGQ